MSKSRWAPIIPHLQEFQRHLAPHVPLFQIEHLNDRRWVNERRREFLEQLKTGKYDLPGIYLIYNNEEQLEYVGMATGTFHHRIWDHDEIVERLYADIL